MGFMATTESLAVIEASVVEEGEEGAEVQAAKNTTIAARAGFFLIMFNFFKK
jgi:hypothetical protein